MREEEAVGSISSGWFHSGGEGEGGKEDERAESKKQGQLVTLFGGSPYI